MSLDTILRVVILLAIGGLIGGLVMMALALDDIAQADDERDLS